MSGPDARNQVKRWEKNFPPHIARAIILDMYAHTRSPHNREVYGAWLNSHPAPIQGTTLHIEQFREAPGPTGEEMKAIDKIALLRGELASEGIRDFSVSEGPDGEVEYNISRPRYIVNRRADYADEDRS